MSRIVIADLPEIQDLNETELQEIYGAGRRRQRNCQIVGTEPLEVRQLMTTGTLLGSVLKITGTESSDQIRISETAGKISIEGVLIKDGTTLLSNIDVNRIQSIAVDAGKGSDEIWVGGGTGVLSRALDITGSQGRDELHSLDLVFATGLDDGVQKLVQFNGATYSTGVNGSLSIDGKQMLLGGFNLSAVSISVTDSGLSVEGTVTAPIVGTITVRGTISADGRYSLSPRDPVKPSAVLGGMVTLSGLGVTITQRGMDLKAHAEIASIAQFELTGLLTADGGYQLKGKGGVAFGPLEFEGVDFVLGSEDVMFSVPLPSIGIVDFRGSVAPTGQWSIQGTYPATVMVGVVPLHNITVGLGSEGFLLGADTGIDGMFGVRVEGDFFFDGRFRLRGEPEFKKDGPISLSDAYVTISNDPAITGLRDRTVQMTIDGTLQVVSGPKVKLHGTVDQKGNYDLRSELIATSNLAGLPLKNATFTLSKQNGHGFQCAFSYGVVSGQIKGAISREGKITLNGEASTAGDFKLTKIAVNGEADGGQFFLKSIAGIASAGEFQLTSVVVEISNKNPQKKIIVSISSSLRIQGGPRLDLSGTLQEKGDYSLEAISTLPVAGLEITEVTFRLKKGVGLTFVGDWNFFIFNGKLEGAISSEGRITFWGTSRGKIGGFTLAEVIVSGDLNPATGKHSVTFHTSLELGIAKVSLECTAAPNSSGVWITPDLTGTAEMKGSLARILSGKAHFTLSTKGASFQGSLKLPLGLGSLSVKGTVNTDGTIVVGGKRFSLDQFSLADAARFLNVTKANSVQIVGTLLQAYKPKLGDVVRTMTSMNYSAPEIAKALYAATKDLSAVFWAIASSDGGGQGFVGGVKTMIGANLVANSSVAVGKFLIKTAGLNEVQTAETVYKWLGGTADKLVFAFWAVASSEGGGQGFVGGVNGMIGAKLIPNSSVAVGKFLIKTAGLNVGQTADTVYKWLGSTADKLVFAFWAVASSEGGGQGFVGGVNGMIGAKLISNGSIAVGKFLIKTAGLNVGQSADTVYKWLGGTADKLVFAFWAVASSEGGGQGFVGGVNGMIGAKLIPNSSVAVGKFLMKTAGLSLKDAAQTVFDWVSGSSGDKLRFAFWAIVSPDGASRSYADGIRGLVQTGKLGTGLKEVSGFLFGVLQTDVAIRVLKELGFIVSSIGGKVNVGGVTIDVSTSGGKVQVGGVVIRW